MDNKQKVQHNIVIDATAKPLGRLATEVATLLCGKNLPQYRAHLDIPVVITLVNWKKITFSGNKTQQKRYYSHSGYLGGISSISLEDLWKKDPQKVIEHAVIGMLAKNKLASNRMKRLKFSNEGEKNV